MRWAGHFVRMDAGKTSKESRGGKTSRTQEKEKATGEMGGLRDSSLRQIGEDERCRDGAADIKLWKERTERVARHYFTWISPLYSREQGGRAHKKYHFNSFLDRKIPHESARTPICPAIVEWPTADKIRVPYMAYINYSSAKQLFHPQCLQTNIIKTYFQYFDRYIDWVGRQIFLFLLMLGFIQGRK